MNKRPQVLVPVLFGKIRYLLRDDFSDTRAAGAVNGTASTPGPGTRTVTDTGNDLSITGGNLVIAGGASAWGDPDLRLDSIARVAGRILVSEFNHASALRGGVGFFEGIDLSNTNNWEGTTYFTATTNLVVAGRNGSPQLVFVKTVATSYKVAIVLRANGTYHFVKGGSEYPNWTLLWSFADSVIDPIYPIIFGRDAVFNSSFLRIPQQLWLPTPLAYDTFTRGDGAIGSTENAGPDSQYVAPRTWTGSTCTVSSNKAIITPATFGSEELTNGGFDNWTGDDPDSWTVSGESGADPEITEVAAGEAHADAPTAGGKHANFYSSATDNAPTILQAITTANKWYYCEMDIDTETAAGAQLLSHGGKFWDNCANGAGIYYFTFLADGANFSATGKGPPLDVTVDSISVKELTLSELFSTVDAGQQDVVIDVDIVHSAGKQVKGTCAGVVLCLDDAATPANFIIAITNGNKLYLEKCVAGTYTSLINSTYTYSSGATLRVVKDGTSVSVFYNNAKVGTTQTVSDAGVKDNTIHGLFSTYASNTMDNFTLYPRGNDNEYQKLDEFIQE
jgi:hypothetical protein